jgi:hypothetical protein
MYGSAMNILNGKTISRAMARKVMTSRKKEYGFCSGAGSFAIEGEEFKLSIRVLYAVCVLIAKNHNFKYFQIVLAFCEM